MMFRRLSDFLYLCQRVHHYKSYDLKASAATYASAHASPIILAETGSDRPAASTEDVILP